MGATELWNDSSNERVSFAVRRPSASGLPSRRTLLCVRHRLAAWPSPAGYVHSGAWPVRPARPWSEMESCVGGALRSLAEPATPGPGLAGAAGPEPVPTKRHDRTGRWGPAGLAGCQTWPGPKCKGSECPQPRAKGRHCGGLLSRGDILAMLLPSPAPRPPGAPALAQPGPAGWSGPVRWAGGPGPWGRVEPRGPAFQLRHGWAPCSARLASPPRGPRGRAAEVRKKTNGVPFDDFIFSLTLWLIASLAPGPAANALFRLPDRTGPAVARPRAGACRWRHMLQAEGGLLGAYDASASTVSKLHACTSCRIISERVQQPS